MPGRQVEHFSCGVNLHRFRLLRCTLDLRFGSKPEKLNASKCFPLFTQQRTLPRYLGMSVSCTKSGRWGNRSPSRHSRAAEVSEGVESDDHRSVRSPLLLNDRTSEACCSFAS